MTKYILLKRIHTDYLTGNQALIKFIDVIKQLLVQQLVLAAMLVRYFDTLLNKARNHSIKLRK